MLTRPLAAALAGLVVLSACTNEEQATGPRALPPTTPSRLIVGSQRTDLGTLGGASSAAAALNNSGQVVGYSHIPASLDQRAFLWREGVGILQNIGTLDPANPGYTLALGINDAGQVVGRSWASGATRPFLWEAGTGMVALATFGGVYSEASDINKAGQIVGISTRNVGFGFTRAVLWESPLRIRDLGTLGGDYAEADAINDSGVVVGSAATSSAEHPFLWREGQGMRDLGTLSGPGGTARASDINSSGQVVGVSSTVTGEKHAFLWEEGTGMRDLGTLGGSTSVAVAINDAGAVVGFSSTAAAGVYHPFLWTASRGMVDISAASGLDEVTDVNDSLVVVGWNTAKHAALAHLHDFNFPPDGIVWDGARDFSVKENPSGSWSSGWVSTLGEKLILFQKTASLSGGELTAWVDPSLDAKYTSKLARNESGKRVDGIDPAQIALIPGCDPAAVAVLRWTAPDDGSYAVSGRFFDGDFGDASAYILASSSGAKPLFSASSTKSSPTFELTAQLAAGDYLDFAVSAGRDGCAQGATPLDVRIERKAK